MTPPETAAKPEAKKVNIALIRLSAPGAIRLASTNGFVDRLVDWRDSCWRCRRPIVPGQLWTAVSNGEAVARFHKPCHAQWLTEQEALARRALGLDR
jgi:hypothetical protein